MILNTWFHFGHPHGQPRPQAGAPEQALFRSARGQLIATRPAALSDLGMIADLLAGLSAQSLFLRYCMPIPRMGPEMVARETARLGQRSGQQFTIVALAEIGGVERAIGVAELVRDATNPAVAEIALVVADAYQRAGIGSALCNCLVAAARQQGLAGLRALALAENTGVRRMLAHIGAPRTAEIRQGMLTVQFDLGSRKHNR
jgi:acetyltransferase